MKKKARTFLLALLCVGVIAAGFSMCAFTLTQSPRPVQPLDFGDSVDYGGSYDSSGGYSSSDGSWGGSYDSGSSYGGGSSSYYRGSSRGGSSENFEIGMFIVLAVIIAVAVYSKMKKQSAGRTGGSPPSTPRVMPGDHTDQITAFIRKKDVQFSAERFEGFARDIFVKLQLAWMARDLAEIRPLVKEELYEQHERQVQEYIKLGRINRIERIHVKQTYLHLYRTDAQYEYLSVFLQARMNDYIIDEKTRAVLKGDPNRELHLDYLLTFTRTLGVLSQSAENGTASRLCPHCGAPIQMASSGRCEYCGSVVTTGAFDWTLSEITRVRPDTRIDNRGVIEE